MLGWGSGHRYSHMVVGDFIHDGQCDLLVLSSSEVLFRFLVILLLCFQCNFSLFLQNMHQASGFTS